MNRVDTVIGAFMAGGILFASNMVTLFTENPELTLSMVSQSTWIAVGGGAAVAFFKDYQAISTRRAINSMRKQKDAG